MWYNRKHFELIIKRCSTVVLYVSNDTAALINSCLDYGNNLLT